MEPLAAGTVVLVRFPFSDLSSSKLRPALVMASPGRGDVVLCQITSNPYADPRAVELDDTDFEDGGLERKSYIRPAKLFTAHEGLIEGRVGVLTANARARAVGALVGLLQEQL